MPLVAYSTQAASYPYILAPHSDAKEEEVLSTVMDTPSLSKYFEGKEIRKRIFIPNKILNIICN